MLTDGLEKHCIGLAPMLDKKPASRKIGLSTHPMLWICSGFSTDAGNWAGFLASAASFGSAKPAGSNRPCSPLRSIDHFLSVDKTKRADRWREHRSLRFDVPGSTTVCSLVARGEAGLSTLADASLFYRYKYEYKLVVVVNGRRTVDKHGLLHRLKGLRAAQALEQGLRPAGIETGQKIAVEQVRHFRTFVPVDMHGLIHN